MSSCVSTISKHPNSWEKNDRQYSRFGQMVLLFKIGATPENRSSSSSDGRHFSSSQHTLAETVHEQTTITVAVLTIMCKLLVKLLAAAQY